MNNEAIIAEKDAMIAQLIEANQNLQQAHEQVLQELAHLRKLIYASKRERFIAAAVDPQ